MAKNNNNSSNVSNMNGGALIVGGMRTSNRRRQMNSSSNASRQRRKSDYNANSILKIYGDDSSGFKLTPQTVLVATLIFMTAVVILHIFNKI